MRLPTRLLVNFILLLFLYTVNGNSNFNKDVVVLVAPVLAPIKNPRARYVETAKDFPVLRLFSSDDASKVNEFEHKENSQPIYVKEKHYQEISIIHHIKKRDVSAFVLPQRDGVQSKQQTIIIVPNEGQNNPYNNNPYPRYGSYGDYGVNPNSGTTIIVKNPGTNYKTSYSG